MMFWNGHPISVEPPKHMLLEVAETDAGVHRNASSSGLKPATLETNLVVRVQLFIFEGDTAAGRGVGTRLPARPGVPE